MEEDSAEKNAQKATDDVVRQPRRRRRLTESKWDDPNETSAQTAELYQKPVNEEQNKRRRRLYIGNFPSGTTYTDLVQFFRIALRIKETDDEGSPTLPVISKTEIFNEDQGYCFLEFSTPELADECFKLDGIAYKGRMIKIRRPIDYGTTSSSEDTKVFVQNIPSSMSENEIKELLEKHGKLSSANLAKDLKTGEHKGYGFFEFDDSRAAKMAVCHLNGFVVGKNVLSVKHAAFSYFGSGGKINDCKATNLPSSVTQLILSNPLLGLQMQSGRRLGSQPSRVVQLLNVAFHEDLINDTKYNELKEAISAEAGKYGKLEDVFIPRPQEDISYREGVGKVFLKFADELSGRKAQYMLNGRLFDKKRVVCAAFFPLEWFLQGKYTLI